MHDTELIDNCFFSSKEKVTAQAQTVPIDMVEKAISARTLITNTARDMASRHTSIIPFSRKSSIPGIKSQKIKKNTFNSEEEEGGPSDMLVDRELIISERAKPRNTNLARHDSEELISGDNLMLEFDDDNTS